MMRPVPATLTLALAIAAAAVSGASSAQAQAPAQPRARAAAPAAPQAPRSAQSIAPVGLTGYWTTVVSEDWAWRMRTAPKGDYASVPLTAEGTRAASSWTQAQDGSCLAFGAAGLMRMPTRVHITWADANTLKIESDNGLQTRLLRFDPGVAGGRSATTVAAGTTAGLPRGNGGLAAADRTVGAPGSVDIAAAAADAARAGGGDNSAPGVNTGASSAAAGAAQPTARASAWLSAAAIGAGPHTLQGESHAQWQIADIVRASGADGGVTNTRVSEQRWAALEVVTANLSAGWLRRNGVPYTDSTHVTEYFDVFADGDDVWFTVTTMVDDPAYLTEPFVTSSNFKREPNGSKWQPSPCKS